MSKNKQDYILIILNCYMYKYKRQLQINTWLKDIPPQLKYFHVIGDKNKCGDKNFLIDFSNNILYTSTPDDYVSLPLKVITALEAIHHTYDYKCVFKTDDDQVLVKSDFFSLLMNKLNKKIFNYGGHINYIKQDVICDYHIYHPSLPKNYILKKTMYCAGRFYFLSNKSVTLLLNFKEFFKYGCIEDHLVGWILNHMSDFKSDIWDLKIEDAFHDIKDNIIIL